MRKKAFVGLLSLLPLVGCGKELGRLPMRTEGTQEAQINVTAGKPLSFWTYFDVADDGTFRASYEIDLVENGAVKAHTSCNPYDVSVKANSRELHIGGTRSVKYDAKMRCELVPPSSGTMTARVKLVFATHPSTLQVTNATLLIKE